MTFTVTIPSHSYDIIPIPTHSHDNTLFPFSPDHYSQFPCSLILSVCTFWNNARREMRTNYSIKQTLPRYTTNMIV